MAVGQRERAMAVARACSTVVLMRVKETQEMVARLFNRPPPLIVFKVNPNGLIERPNRLRYRTQRDGRINGQYRPRCGHY